MGASSIVVSRTNQFGGPLGAMPWPEIIDNLAIKYLLYF